MSPCSPRGSRATSSSSSRRGEQRVQNRLPGGEGGGAGSRPRSGFPYSRSGLAIRSPSAMGPRNRPPAPGISGRATPEPGTAAGGASGARTSRRTGPESVSGSPDRSAAPRGASSRGCTIRPESTSGPTGCSRNSNDVTMPKLPPPPRMPQNRSGCSEAVAGGGRHRGDDVRGHQVVDRESQAPAEPAESSASVRPEMPVVELIPTGTASPLACVARSTSPSVAPGPTRASRADGSTSDGLHGREVDRQAVVAEAFPAILCPPRGRRRAGRVRRQGAPREPVVGGRAPAISAGFRSIMAFQMPRAASYPVCA